MIKPYKLGVDLGGTKIEAVLLDAYGDIVFRKRIATPGEYRSILSGIQKLTVEAEKQVGVRLSVGVGLPGALSPRTGLLRNANTRCLNGRDLMGDLQQLLQRPVRLQNDANCFVLSEAMDGAARDFSVVFGVIIGTGTGGGLVFNKQLITGRHAIAGEWGHNPLPWGKPFDIQRDCYCGKQGCIETFLSGPGMADNVRALSGLELSSRQIVEAAERGDERCLLQMDHYHDQLARALAQVINIVDPDAIVLGGGMSNIQSIYSELPQRLGQYVFSDYVDTPILAPKFCDSSGVRGAAWLWP